MEVDKMDNTAAETVQESEWSDDGDDLRILLDLD